MGETIKSFKIGDRVIGHGVQSQIDITGMVGTIVYDNGRGGGYGVYFDESHSHFHDIGGHCPRGHGWNCRGVVLEPYNECPEYQGAPNVIDLL